MNIEENSSDKAAAARKEKRERTKSRIEGDQVGSSFNLRKVMVVSTRWKLAEVVGRVPTSFPGIMTPNSSTESMSLAFQSSPLRMPTRRKATSGNKKREMKSPTVIMELQAGPQPEGPEEACDTKELTDREALPNRICKGCH